MTSSTADLDTAAAVLEFAQGESAAADRAEANKLQAAVTWAGMHSVDSLTEAATVWDHGETGLPVAGPGHPWSRSSRSPSSPPRSGCPPRPARPTSARPSSLRYRLRRIWARVVGDHLPAWRRRRSPAKPSRCRGRRPRTSTCTSPTSRTRSAPPSSTGSSRKPSAGSCPRRPNAAAAKPPTAAASPSTPASPHCGRTSPVYGELDLADALDLDAAVTAGAGR